MLNNQHDCVSKDLKFTKFLAPEYVMLACLLMFKSVSDRCWLNECENVEASGSVEAPNNYFVGN